MASSSATRVPSLSFSSWFCNPDSKTLNPFISNANSSSSRRFKRGVISMRDRSKNRKPLQRGRNLSIEAIQTVQALKRAANNNNNTEVALQRVFEDKVRRLLKLDMLAVLRELIRQNQPLLAFKVFQDVRKEYWYKPQLVIYADMIKMFASNSLFQKVELLLHYLKTEIYLNATTEDFNALFRTLIDFGFTTHAVQCFQFMKEVQCDPDESTFRILVNGFESKGETDLSFMIRQEAEKHFGWPLEFPEEEEEMSLTCS